MRGEFVRGLDDGRGVDSGRNIKDHQGDQNRQHSHSTSVTSTVNDPGHIHQVQYSNSDSGDGVIEESGTGLSGQEPTLSATTGITVNTTVTVQNDPISQSQVEARPRNVAMLYVIKT